MNPMKYLSLTALTLLLLVAASCSNPPERITRSADYEGALQETNEETLTLLKADHDFWKQRLDKDSSQFPYRTRLASVNYQLFKATGHIQYLVDAEYQWTLANQQTHHQNATMLRGLAYTLMARHKFKEALEVLKKAEDLGEDREATRKMLFDVYLELALLTEAKETLDGFTDRADFDYLIRIAKWNDHLGDLTTAIRYMEKASARAHQQNNTELMKWSLTNLADFYGHDGQVNKAYKNYLKALKLDPEDAYAKKGIAWIAYAHDKDPYEALRILRAIQQSYESPDLYLFQAELATFMGHTKATDTALNLFLKEVAQETYANMYLAHHVLICTDDLEAPQKALALALQEVKNRATAQSYDLLAWSYYKNGDLEKAREIIDLHVYQKTFEPTALYHMAMIYRSVGKIGKLLELKKALKGSDFEVGPLQAAAIARL